MFSRPVDWFLDRKSSMRRRQIPNPRPLNESVSESCLIHDSKPTYLFAPVTSTFTVCSDIADLHSATLKTKATYSTICCLLRAGCGNVDVALFCPTSRPYPDDATFGSQYHVGSLQDTMRQGCNETLGRASKNALERQFIISIV